jgi:hypothetical protein
MIGRIEVHAVPLRRSERNEGQMIDDVGREKGERERVGERMRTDAGREVDLSSKAIRAVVLEEV